MFGRTSCGLMRLVERCPVVTSANKHPDLLVWHPCVRIVSGKSKTIASHFAEQIERGTRTSQGRKRKATVILRLVV